MDPKEALKLINPKEIASLTKGLLSGKNSRIGNITAAVLLLAASGVDLLTTIPLVGDIAGPIFWGLVALYLWHLGCGFVKGLGRFAVELASTVMEMVPALQELPTIVVAMAIVILLIRLEDRTGKSVIKPLMQARGGKVNIDGRREAPPRQILNPGDSRPPQIDSYQS